MNLFAIKNLVANLGTLKITHVQYGVIRIPTNSTATIQLEKQISSIDDIAVSAMEIGDPTVNEASIFSYTKTTITLKSNHSSNSSKKYMIFYFNSKSIWIWLKRAWSLV